MQFCKIMTMAFDKQCEYKASCLSEHFSLLSSVEDRRWDRHQRWTSCI